MPTSTTDALAAYWAGSCSASVARSAKRAKRFGDRRGWRSKFHVQLAAFGALGLCFRICIQPSTGVVGATCLAVAGCNTPAQINVTCWPRQGAR